MQVRAGELISSLHHIQAEGFSCIVEFESNASIAVSSGQTPPNIFKCSLVFQSGALTYAGRKVPAPLEFAHWVSHKMQLAHMESTLQMVTSRVKNPNSVRELIEFITRFGLIKWPDLENLMHREAAVFLEQAQLCPGVLQKKMSSSFDLSYGEDHHGLNLALIQQILDKRKQLWQSLAPEIVLDTVLCPRPDKASFLPPQILPHFSRWITGQFKLSEIAWGCGEDPLNLAQTYLKWSRQDWLSLKNISNSPRSTTLPPGSVTITRPIILSVDDSKIVQTMITRAIGDLYDVQLANNATDALNILQLQKVELLLLDVTMPDIDGLELCRTIRAMPQFKQLPIIMLTAKDGIIDKFKGQFAGSTQYLTKPIDREKLLPVLEKYIPQVASQTTGVGK
jgi:CheY-like chemotaxis protein